MSKTVFKVQLHAALNRRKAERRADSNLTPEERRKKKLQDDILFSGRYGSFGSEENS